MKIANPVLGDLVTRSGAPLARVRASSPCDTRSADTFAAAFDVRPKTRIASVEERWSRRRSTRIMLMSSVRRGQTLLPGGVFGLSPMARLWILVGRGGQYAGSRRKSSKRCAKKVIKAKNRQLR